MKDQNSCPQANENYKGATATTWNKWTCKDCGKVDMGQKRPEPESSVQLRSHQEVHPPLVHLWIKLTSQSKWFR